MQFGVRDLLVRQRTQTINALRGHLAEFGVIAPKGPVHVRRLALAIADPETRLPATVRELGGLLLEQIAELDRKIAERNKELYAAVQDEGRCGRRRSPISALAPGSGAAACELPAGRKPGWAWCRASTPRRPEDLEDGPAGPERRPPVIRNAVRPASCTTRGGADAGA